MSDLPPPADPHEDAVAAAGYRLAAVIIVAVAAALSLARIAAAPPLQSANDRSRWATVYSLVHHGTYHIDRIDASPAWQTIDKVRHEGHFYSSKPPLLATVVAGVYRLVRAATGLTLDGQTETTTRLLLLIVNWLPAVVSWTVAAWTLPRLGGGRLASLVVLTAAATATLATPFLATLNNHSVGVAGLWLTLGCCAAYETTGRKTLAAAGAGFFAAWTVCNELPAFPLGAALFVWFWRADARRAWLAFAPAAAVPLVAFFVTNAIVTGGLKPFYLSYGTETYVYTHRGVPSYWTDPAGIDANRDGFWTYLLHCTVGHHGILSLTPLWLVTLRSWTLRKRTDGSSLASLRTWTWLTIGLTIWTLAFFLSKTQNYNYGGSSCGLRWVLWLSPLWLVTSLPGVSRLLRTPGRAAALAVLLAASMFFAWEPWSTPWTQPWLYRQMQQLGWIDYSTPLRPLRRPTVTWLNRLPSGDADPDYWCEWYVDGVTPRLVRLEDAGPDGEARVLRLVEGDDARQLRVRPRAFEDGGKAHTWAVDGVTRDTLVGLPTQRPYRPGRPDYLFTPVQDDAIATQKLATRVPDRRSGTWLRRDVWWSDTVPFGVPQMVITRTARDGTVLGRETWRVLDVGRTLADGEPGP